MLRRYFALRYLARVVTTLRSGIADGQYLSKPEHLITTAIAVELVFLLSQVLQFYEHTLFFPPVGGSKGDFYSLLHSVFGWAPVSTLTIKLPEIRSLFSGEVWSAISWWYVQSNRVQRGCA